MQFHASKHQTEKTLFEVNLLKTSLLYLTVGRDYFSIDIFDLFNKLTLSSPIFILRINLIFRRMHLWLISQDRLLSTLKYWLTTSSFLNHDSGCLNLSVITLSLDFFKCLIEFFLNFLTSYTSNNFVKKQILQHNLHFYHMTHNFRIVLDSY